MTFDAAVWALVRRIPEGYVVTYGQVASLVGRARAARAVGGAMARCPNDVPWHRVVNSQGAISRRRRDSSMLTQRIRLEQEGVRLRRGRVPLARYQWEPTRRELTRRHVNLCRTTRESGGRKEVRSARRQESGRIACGGR